MKIVHINATDARGGATIAMMRHSDAMNRAGYASSIVVASHTIGINRLLRSIYFRINNKREHNLCATANFSIMNFGLPLHKNQIIKEADVVYLHWVCANSLSIDGIERILELGKPTFWYMHDMFPFTGGCHYSLGCNEYKDKCQNCPQIANLQKKEVASKQLANKIKHWHKYSNLEFVAPSSWEAECAKQSSLCAGHKVHVVPNIIDTEVYKPMESTKNAFGLDPRKKTILFSATRISSPYKGARYAHDCLCLLDPDKYEGLVIGKADMNFISDLPIKIVQTGFLDNDTILANAYNACDAFLMTSVAESFGQVVAEAMACGKPCVGFPTGGVLDLIINHKTGCLTEKYEAIELKNAIDSMFSDQENYNNLAENSRRWIVNNFSFKNVISIHTELKPFLVLPNESNNR